MSDGEPLVTSGGTDADSTDAGETIGDGGVTEDGGVVVEETDGGGVAPGRTMEGKIGS